MIWLLLKWFYSWLNGLEINLAWKIEAQKWPNIIEKKAVELFDSCLHLHLRWHLEELVFLIRKKIRHTWKGRYILLNVHLNYQIVERMTNHQATESEVQTYSDYAWEISKVWKSALCYVIECKEKGKLSIGCDQCK